MSMPGGPRLDPSLLKAIGVSDELRKAPAEEEGSDDSELDVYEYEEGVPEEERGKNKRFDEVERIEYELPSDFEDEEIDEDAAFGEEEDAPALGRVAKRTKEIDLNSDEDSEDNDGEESVEDEMEDDKEGNQTDESSEESESVEEEEEEEEEDDGKHRRMIEAVTGNVANGMADKPGKRRKERILSEAYPESEFNLNPSANGADGKSGISVEDLIMPLRDTAGFGSIRKRMQQLQKRGAPVEAPLPKVIQERLNRKAGYEKTKEDITKWQPIVKRNREAPTLVLNKPELAPTLSTAALAANFKPTTDFEREVQNLLQESNVTDVKNVEAAEALDLNKLTVNEVQERQERLAKMRHLLFRHEAKAKRVKKIKSKTFHRLLQKSQKSKAEADAAVAGVDPEAAKAAVMRREFNRAQERMTLKHKNSTRWAKRILKRGLKASENDGTRDAIADQLRTHAALTRKIHSATRSDSDNTSSESEEENEDVVPGLVLDGNSRSKVLAKAKVATLKALEEGEDADIAAAGLFSLPFMARAIEKKKKTTENEALALLDQLEQAEDDSTELGLGDDFLRNKEGLLSEPSTTGRSFFGVVNPANSRDRRESSTDLQGASDGESDDELTDNATRHGSTRKVSNIESTTHRGDFPRKIQRGRQKKIDSEYHALAETRQNAALLEGEKMALISEDAAPAKLGNRAKISHNGRMSSTGVETVPTKHFEVAIAGTQKQILASTAHVQEDTSKSNQIAVSSGTSLTKVENAAGQSTFSDDDSDTDAQGPGLLDASSSQQELIRQAFAGDDVEAEFEKVKSQILDEEVPQGEGPISLPGWGQWTRVQQTRSQPAWLVKEQEMLKRKRESALSKRKDAKLKHVIISEKQDKKAAKFTAASVPFPFKSRDVFERSIRLPIGRDFNTERAHRDMVRPDVVKSAGFIIDPIKFDKHAVQKKEKVATAHVTKRKRRQ